MNENVDNVLEYVRDFDKPSCGEDKPVNMAVKKDLKKASKKVEKKKPVMDVKTRNYLLKGLAGIAFAGGCEYWELMHRGLYVILGLYCLCAVCIKFGEWRGRTSAERG